MNKKIITIAEIVFALVFVVLMAVFMATINSKGNSANTQLVDTLEMTDGTSINKYETITKVKGTEVQNTVSNYKTLSSSNKLTIAVQTTAMNKKSVTSWDLYGYDLKGETHKSYTKTSTDDGYINPNGDFAVRVIKNNNDVIVGLAFQQDKETVDDSAATAITGTSNDAKK